jgi:hypothetical protein
MIVIRFLSYFPFEHSWPFSIKVLSGKHLKNKPVSSTLKISLGEKPAKTSGRFLIQFEQHVSTETLFLQTFR